MIPQEAKTLHRHLSQPAAALLDLAEVEPECRRRPDLSRDLPDWIAVYTVPIQSWPTILEGRKLAEIRRGALSVPRLIKSIPARIFGNDAASIARFYGIADQGLIRSILAQPDGLSMALSRGDYVDTPSGFKCLEVNLSACLGGWQIRFFASRLLERPWLQELLRGVPAAFVDPLAALFTHLVDNALRSPLASEGEVNIAFLLPADLMAHSHPSFRAFLADEYASFLTERHPSLGGNLLFSTYDRLRREDGRVFLGDARLHAAIDFHDPFFDSHIDPVLYEGFKAGELHLYNSPAACLLSDKRNIALLSEHEGSDLFSEQERADIRAYIPWSRLARPGWTDFQGERVELPSFVVAARERLVLKQGRSGRGHAVHVGRSTPPEEWEKLVARVFAAGDWIVQEMQDSLPYWYQAGESGTGPHDAVWGLFAYGDLYGGGYMRVLPPGNTGIVNTAHGAAEGLILEIEEAGRL
jgi:hypothetical protein